ncbi:MAG: hypothetical protein PETM_02107 [Petrimonas sp.]|jgi:predicted Fe-Mo cluster-binding NifX family protein|uniref:NifB/NifX family molybdenum-iron cluster-binding protein n=1 Tax=Petrimonas sp. TaxID=2023866 RepID=UPI0030CDF16C
MKVAITSSGKELTSLPDKRFGRCNCFVIYDTENDSVEIVDNPNRESNEGAGPAAAQLIASKGAEMIITGHLGGKAASVVQQLGIGMTPLDDNQRSVEEVIQKIKQHN